MSDAETILAQLLSGVPVPSADLDALGEPGREIARRVAGANGNSALAAFDLALVDLLPEGERATFKAAVFAVAPTDTDEPSADIEPLADVPELPVEARLSPLMERAAQKVGEWLTAYITFANEAAPMTPVEFHEALGLAICSTAVARRISLSVSNTRIFPNIYLLLVARSTLWHKTTGFDLARGVMNAAGMSCLQIGPRQTPESLMMELSTRHPPTFGDWDKESKEHWGSERRFAAQRAWLMEEASSLFDAFQRDYSSGLLPMLLDLFDCPDERQVNTIGRGRQSVRRSYLTIAGPTTPAAIAPHVGNAAHWENGLWARFALVTPSGMPQWKFWPQHLDTPTTLTDTLKRLTFDRLPVPAVTEDDTGAGNEAIEPLPVVLSDGVWNAWECYSKAISFDLLMGGDVDGRIYASYGRLGHTAMKLAMLLATLDWADLKTIKSPRVTLGHWARGQQIAETWRASLHRMITAPATESNANADERKVWHIIVKADKARGLTRREIANNTHLERMVVDLAVDRLHSDGLIERFTRPGGQKAEVFRIVKA